MGGRRGLACIQCADDWVVDNFAHFFLTQGSNWTVCSTTSQADTCMESMPFPVPFTSIVISTGAASVFHRGGRICQVLVVARARVPLP